MIISSSSVFLANRSTTDDAKMMAFCKISEMPEHTPRWKKKKKKVARERSHHR
jgi:hypothetical protein